MQEIIDEDWCCIEEEGLARRKEDAAQSEANYRRPTDQKPIPDAIQLHERIPTFG